jgi:hypothetical protein
MEPVAAGAAAAALTVSLALVTGHSAPIPLALALLGALYVLPDGERGVWAPLYGGGLLLCAELAYWSLEERRARRVRGDVATPRLVAVLLVAVLSVGVAAVVLLAAEVDIGRSPVTTAVAAVAVAACAGLLVALARARPAAQRTPISTSTSS